MANTSPSAAGARAGMQPIQAECEGQEPISHMHATSTQHDYDHPLPYILFSCSSSTSFAFVSLGCNVDFFLSRGVLLADVCEARSLVGKKLRLFLAYNGRRPSGEDLHKSAARRLTNRLATPF